MSNLNTHGVTDFKSAKAFLGDKSHRTLCFATTLTHEAIEPGRPGIVVRHYGTPIIRYFTDGTVDIRNAGWLTATTTTRLHQMTPSSVRVSRAKGGNVESSVYNGPQPRDFETVVPAGMLVWSATQQAWVNS